MHVLKTILGWLLGLVLLALVTNISISNNHDTAIYLWPYAQLAMVPLWMIVLGSFSVGLIIGGLILWPKLFMSRLRIHQGNRRIQRLESDLADMSEHFGEDGMTSNQTSLITMKDKTDD